MGTFNLEQTNQGLKEFNNINNKNIVHKIKTFFKPGEVIGGIVNLSILSVGIGSLSLPVRYSQMSVLAAFIVVLIGGLTALWTLKILVKAGNKSKIYSYSKLLHEYYGIKATLALNVTVIIMVFGMLIVYQVIIYEMIGAFYYEVQSKENKSIYQNDIKLFYKLSIFGKLWFRFVVMISICIIVVIPINLLKDISKLKFTSLGGIICLFYITIVIIIQLPSYIKSYSINKINIEDNVNWYNILTGFNKNLNFFKGASLLFYAYNCHHGIFPVLESLVKTNKLNKANTITLGSIIVDGLFYMVVGICGYLTQPVNTPKLILNRKQIGDSDLLMTSCRLFICLVLIAKTPANYNNFRISFFNIFFKDYTITILKNLSLTIPVSIITCVVGVFVNDISSVLSFIGGVCSINLCFVFPFLIYLKDQKESLKKIKNITIITYILIIVIIGYIGGIVSLIEIINQFKLNNNQDV